MNSLGSKLIYAFCSSHKSVALKAKTSNMSFSIQQEKCKAAVPQYRRKEKHLVELRVKNTLSDLGKNMGTVKDVLGEIR